MFLHAAAFTKGMKFREELLVPCQHKDFRFDAAQKTKTRGRASDALLEYVVYKVARNLQHPVSSARDCQTGSGEALTLRA
jgi:hypothetical protein